MDTLRDMSLESEQARTNCAKLMLLHDCMMTLHLTSFLTLCSRAGRFTVSIDRTRHA